VVVHERAKSPFLLFIQKPGVNHGIMITEAIKEVIESKCLELGVELFDLRLFQAGSRSTLRITIDSAHGVTVGDCERVSNELSVLLDVENFLQGQSYNLEVTSPGIDRSLKTERDFKRTIGRFVTMQMAPVFEGKKTLRGKIVGCANGSVECDIEGRVVSLPVSMIASGKEELQFS
jgi:ribosome maturation factor RimP